MWGSVGSEGRTVVKVLNRLCVRAGWWRPLQQTGGVLSWGNEPIMVDWQSKESLL